MYVHIFSFYLNIVILYFRLSITKYYYFIKSVQNRYDTNQSIKSEVNNFIDIDHIDITMKALRRDINMKKMAARILLLCKGNAVIYENVNVFELKYLQNSIKQLFPGVFGYTRDYEMLI